MAQYFILEYTDKHPGCPTYLATELNHEETEWPAFVLDPHALSIPKQYRLRITDPDIRQIAFDMEEGNQPCVSQQFLAVCDKLGVPYRAVPVEIELFDGTKPEKRYSIFLAGASLSLLDRAASDYEEARDLETGDVEYHGTFSEVPLYDVIGRFVPKQISTPHLFFCTEILKLVCTSEFKEAGEKLLGVSYRPLDDSYRYAPWESELE